MKNDNKCEIFRGDACHLGWIANSLRSIGINAEVDHVLKNPREFYDCLAVDRKHEMSARTVAREYIKQAKFLLVDMRVSEVGCNRIELPEMV